MARLASLAPRLTTLDTRTAKPPRADKDKLPFYRSPKWRAFIAALIKKRGRKCEECGEKNCRIFGDHIEELQDGGAPFDEDNVLLRCGKCHNKKTAKEKQKRWDGQDLVHPPGLTPSVVPLVIVCGPPASGKTTYIQRHRAPADLVIDLDVIKGKLTGLGPYGGGTQYLAAALKERNKLLLELSETPARWPRAWFIVGEPAAHWRAWWQQQLRPQRVVVIEAPEDVCLARIAASPERAKARVQLSEAVSKWWNAYGRRPGELVIGGVSP